MENLNGGPGAPVAGDPEPAPPGQGILLVDDHPESLLALESALASLGQPMVRAGSGAEALRRILAEDFAVILLDVRMPVMDGYATAEIIRSRERSRHIPILFLTAHPTSELQVFQGYASGAVDFITKPCAPDILRSKVRVFVELARRAAALGALNRRLEGLVAELKDANEQLDAFTHSVSHDLRAPLRQMEGFLSLLEGQQPPGEPGRTWLESARASARWMDQLVEGLLGLARTARAEMIWTPVDLNPLVQAIVRDLETQWPCRQVQWLVGALPTVQGDAALLRAAFQNLLGNACKFTRNRARAVIEVGLAAGPPEEWWVRIQDNGDGFDPAYVHKLFGVFQRLHPQEAFEGTGLGLANVQRILQRHHGRIWAEGRPGEGATFHLALPKGAAR